MMSAGIASATDAAKSISGRGTSQLITPPRKRRHNMSDLFINADFDGETYDRDRDQVRLAKQAQAVFNLMADGQWRTLRAISQCTGYPEPSVSARLRDMRKAKFGSHAVNRQYVHRGLYQYQLLRNEAI
jgi:hypothetical protein